MTDWRSDNYVADQYRPSQFPIWLKKREEGTRFRINNTLLNALFYVCWSLFPLTGIGMGKQVQYALK